MLASDFFLDEPALVSAVLDSTCPYLAIAI